MVGMPDPTIAAERKPTAGPRRSRRASASGWRDFRLLWSGQSVSLLGDQVFLLALPLTAVQVLHASTIQVAILAATARAPFLVIGLPAGVWVTCLGLRRSMLSADIARGLAVVSIPVAAAFGGLTFGQLVVVAAVAGIGTVFFQVAYQSYSPGLIRDDRQLHAANTRLSFSESTALLAGPGLAGTVISITGAARALLTDFGSYLASVLTLALIRHREAPAGIRADRRPFCAEIGDGLRFVARQPVLRPIMVCGALYNFGVAMYDTLLVLFAVRQLHLQPWNLGLALALGGTGFPLGSLLARRLSAKFGLGLSLLLAGIPSVVGLAVGASAFGSWSVPLLAAGTFINGLGQGTFAVNALTIRHLITPPHLVARATAVHRFVTWGVVPAGSAIAGLAGTSLGLRAGMLTAAATTCACMIPLLSRPLRDARQLSRDTAGQAVLSAS
jgi:MFS family permease